MAENMAVAGMIVEFGMIAEVDMVVTDMVVLGR